MPTTAAARRLIARLAERIGTDEACARQGLMDWLGGNPIDGGTVPAI